MNKIAGLMIAAWSLLTIYVVSALMARHQVAFRAPDKLPAVARRLASEMPEMPEVKDGEKAAASFIAVHILDETCTCSRTVLEQLSQESIADTKSIVLTMSESTPETRRRLEKMNIVVQSMNPEDAKAAFGIESVPWLVVLDRQFNLVYKGGYGDTKIRNRDDVRINALMDEIRKGRKPASLPTFGCATSDRLRALLLQF